MKFSYSVKNVREILIEHLISLREQNITLGPTLGECIIPFIMFDHGGTSFKRVVTLLAYELCRTLHAEIIAIGDFKESEEILSHSIMPEINAYMEQMSNEYVVTIEWRNDENITKSDFLLMPKDIFGEGYDNKSRALPAHIVPTYNTVTKQWSLRWGIGDDKQMTFGRLDIPTDRRVLSCRVIPIIPHSGGDFKHQFMVTGRDGHASSKAAFESLLQSIWKYRSVAPGRLAYNQHIRNLDEMMCVLEDSVSEANEQLKTTKATFKATKDAQRNTPVRRQIDDMFNSGGARMTQSYTMQWNGHSCTLVLEFAEEFIAALWEILIAAAKLKEPGDALRCAALELQLGEFLEKLKALWDVYYYINQMLSSFDSQSDAVCDRVERACKAEGLLVRAIGMSVTPKVRSLETTLYQTFRFYEGRTGHLNESPGERVHAKVNSAERHHTNTTKWEDKRDIIDDDAKRADLQAVKSIVANVKQDHTRPQSDDTIVRKCQKIRTVEEVAAAREAALDMLLDSVFAKFGHLVADI